MAPRRRRAPRSFKREPLPGWVEDEGVVARHDDGQLLLLSRPHGEWVASYYRAVPGAPSVTFVHPSGTTHRVSREDFE